MRVLLFSFLILFMHLALSGCMILPVPPSYTDDSRHNIDIDSVEKIIPGKTAMKNLIFQFGEPDFISQDESILLYGIKKTVAYGAVGYGYMGTAGPLDLNYFLVVHLDSSGVVTGVNFHRDDWTWEFPEEFRLMYNSWPPGFNNLSSQYYRLYQNVPLPQNIDHALVNVNDTQWIVKHFLVLPGGAGFLLPSQTEIIRRVFIQKLTDLQRDHKITYPCTYSVDLIDFSINLEEWSFNTYNVNIETILKHLGSEFTLNGYHQMELPLFIGFKEKEEAMNDAIELAVQDLMNNLELKAAQIFNQK